MLNKSVPKLYNNINLEVFNLKSEHKKRKQQAFKHGLFKHSLYLSFLIIADVTPFESDLICKCLAKLGLRLSRNSVKVDEF